MKVTEMKIEEWTIYSWCLEMRWKIPGEHTSSPTMASGYNYQEYCQWVWQRRKVCTKIFWKSLIILRFQIRVSWHGIEKHNTTSEPLVYFQERASHRLIYVIPHPYSPQMYSLYRHCRKVQRDPQWLQRNIFISDVVGWLYKLVIETL